MEGSGSRHNCAGNCRGGGEQSFVIAASIGAAVASVAAAAGGVAVTTILVTQLLVETLVIARHLARVTLNSGRTYQKTDLNQMPTHTESSNEKTTAHTSSSLFTVRKPMIKLILTLVILFSNYSNPNYLSRLMKMMLNIKLHLPQYQFIHFT